MGFNLSWNALSASIISMLTPTYLLTVLGSTTLGIVFGALPGLTATMAVVLLLTLTYGMDTSLALAMLIGSYVGAIYGGSRAAVLINIPGTPSAAATALDGYPLALRGEAESALTTATTASFFGTVFGALVLLLLSPVLSIMALRFGSAEYFLLAIFGILICGSLTTDQPVKGWIAGFFGLFISTIGLEEIYSYPRFAFGQTQLMGGIELIPAMIGVFGIPEVMLGLKETTNAISIQQNLSASWKSIKEILYHIPLVIRSSVIGALIGVLPGVGGQVACWLAYDTEKRLSKHSEQFGKGAIEGVLAAETSNNAVIGGAFVPMLSLGIPGDAVTAVIMGGLMLHGLRPGPLFLFEMPEMYYTSVILIILSSIAMLIMGLLMTPFLVRLLSIPKTRLLPIVAVLCVLGSFSINLNVFDVFVMLIFGIIGYLMKTLRYPIPPMVLGIILGPIADSNLRRSLMLYDGSLLPFFVRPICIVLMILIVLIVISSIRAAKKKNSTTVYE